ncbi:SET domain-containing protein [Caballeronia sp. Lep1P3]|uniref:SET domain-containing protein n=1 Tax=Caballeronia sp. Lep1P3 TaxID=2878150 RepID=UPI00351D1163
MNQTVQNSRPRFVTRRSPVHGRGLFANRALAAGELICEYKGARVGWREVLRRCARDTSESDHTFYFDLGYGTVIDGGEGGNNARCGSITDACRIAKPKSWTASVFPRAAGYIAG